MYSNYKDKSIVFIIVGWHFWMSREISANLSVLQEDNPELGIFWSCHKDPPDWVKENWVDQFEVFPNLGLEDGAYQQALDVLPIKEDCILFLIHDDLIIKDWAFINKCINALNTDKSCKFIGNGRNYPANLPLNKLILGRDPISYVKESAKRFFYTQLGHFNTIRESFICTTRRNLREVEDFEVVWEEPQMDENGKYNIGGIGNLQQSLLSYKINIRFGPDAIKTLGDRYLDSPYIYEMARGEIDPKNLPSK